MTRLSVAIALVLHLSGLSAVAAIVCRQPEMTATSCCCRHGSGEQARGRARSVSTPCPCTMAPQPDPPATPVPATQLTSGGGGAVVLSTLPAIVGPLQAAHLGLHIPVTGDSSPPYLTAAHPRC
jgi:hypothetical protein